MTDEGFANPAPASGGIKFGDHKGALLVVEPISVKEEVSTAFGLSDAVEANIYVIDGAGSPETYEGTLVFPKVLFNQLRNSLGERVLGRLGQGNAKAGQSAPWLLLDPTPADMTIAQKWLNSRKPAFASANKGSAPPF